MIHHNSGISLSETEVQEMRVIEIITRNMYRTKITDEEILGQMKSLNGEINPHSKFKLSKETEKERRKC
jgi:hypothetical protein